MAVSPTTGIVFDPVFLEHETGWGHPESPDRLRAVLSGIDGAARHVRTVSIAARDASVADLRLVHTPAYIAAVQDDCDSGSGTLSTGDTPVCEATFAAAIRAAGGVLAAVDAVMAGTCRNAFCAVRPPGHHATPDRGMGFCVFNNVAIAARHLQRKHGLERILIADWDVHHGNGTQETFYADPSVFFFSIHQWPHYPGTGAESERGTGPGKGFNMNVPLAAGSGSSEVLEAFRCKLVPAMQTFKPQFVLVSAGFDSRAGDPLGGLLLGDSDFAELTRILLGIADLHCEGRFVSVLEGGYALDGLAAATESHVRAMGGGR